MNIAELSASDQLIYSTVQIQTILPGDKMGTGTGFFFNFFHTGSYYMPTIVTNKHVAEDAISATIHFNTVDEQGSIIYGQHQSVDVPNFTERCIPHPDPEVDLCVWLIGGILKALRSEHSIQPFYKGLHSDLIPTPAKRSELLSIEDVLVVGYPNGIWDDANNLPVTRRGITATPPYVLYEGKEAFLIDAPLSHGSSGSPVFLYNAGIYPTRGNNTTVGTRVMLLGIASAMYPQKVEGDFVNKNSLIPVFDTLKVISEIPMNLGLAIWSEKLLDFEPILRPLYQKETESLQELPEPSEEVVIKTKPIEGTD